MNRPVAWPTKAARGAGMLACVLGLGALLSWSVARLGFLRADHLPLSVAPATALGLVLGGLGLLAELAAGARPPRSPRACQFKLIARVAAGATGVFGFLILVKIAINPVVQVLPRMAPATALAFLLLSSALWCLSRRSRPGLFQGLGFGAGGIAALGLLHHLYGGMPLLPLDEMAAATSVGLLALAAGLLLTWPEIGLMALLLSRSAGGMFARRLLPPALVVPFAIGWVRLKGQEAGWFATEGGLTVFAMANVILFVALVWLNAARLHRTDLASQQSAEQLAVSSREIRELKTALDEHAIVAITDPGGRITYVNDKFCAISQYSRAELLGQDHRMINSRHHPPEFFRSLWTTIARGQVWHGEIQNRAKDGSFYWVATTIVPFLSPEGKPRQYIAIRADITERKRAETELQQLNAELEQRVAERTTQLEGANRELEAFSYSVSHDLRAPLRAVNGFAGIVLEDYGALLPEDGRRQLERIRNGGQRMGELIDDLLTFARLSRQPLNRRPVETGRLVQEALGELAPQCRNRNIEWHLADLPPCHGDPALLKQVWINLLSNAIKYTRERDPAVVEVGAQLQNGPTTFFVRDNGAGFDMKYASKLFGVFQRLHRAEQFEGTGVGLAMVQRVVHRHGGQVWAEAEEGRGATFHFTLEATNHP